MQIDADFIAQYQMNYGCGETAETDTSPQYGDDYWSNPPSDINSDEYRVWYERYCSYFYPQAASEGTVSSSSMDAASDTAGLDALLESTVSSAVFSTTVATTDVQRPSDTSNETAASDASGKKRKKSKKDDVANPKPVEPPGELQHVVTANAVTTTAKKT